MAMTQQASSTAKEARSKKLLSLFMAFVMAATLMIPQAAWAEEPEGAPAQTEQDQTAPVEGTGDATGDETQSEQPEATVPVKQQVAPEAEGGNVAAPVSTLEAPDTLQVVGPVQSADPAKPDNEKKFYNVLYANGENVVVEPVAEGGVKVTVGNDVYSFANNSASYFKGATDGLTIFAGGDSAATGDSSITVKSGAKVGAIFAGGNKADYAGTATVVVEEGAEAGTIYGGGLTPAGDKTGTAKTTASIVTVNGKAGIIYAGGMAAVGPTINEVVTFNAEKPAETTAKNYVGSSKVTINGEAACYFGGSYSYGGVGTVSCELNGTLTGSYSAIAGTNGFRGDASMTVGANGKITGLLYMSMRGYIGDTSLVNNGTIGVLTLLPDGTNVSTYGNTDVVNAGTIARAHLDCGCEKAPVLNSTVTPYPETITVDGDVRIRTTTIDEKNGNAENAAKTSTLPEGTALSLLNGATYDGYAVMIGEKGYADFATAAQAAAAGDTLTLLSDQDTVPVVISKNVTIDLGENTLSVVDGSEGANYGIQFAGAGVNTLKNGTLIDTRSEGNTTSNWRAIKVAGEASLSTENVSIQTYRPDAAKYNYLVFVGSDSETAAKAISLGAKTELKDLENSSNTLSETAGAVGLNLIGTTKDASSVVNKISLTVSDGVSIITQGYAITGNGTYHGTDITINGGTITSTGSAAIYHPQAGTLTLNGGVLEGATGIQLCSGNGTVNAEFQFNGGTVKGVGEDERATKTGDGLVSDGSALSLVNRDYPGGAPSITINGGTFASAHNDAVLAYTWAKDAATGKFVASDWADAGKKISITDGTFSSDVSAYVAEGLACSKISEGVYQIQKKIVSGDVEVQAPVVSEGNVPTNKPGVPEKDEALTQIAGSLGDALKDETPVKDNGEAAPTMGGHAIEANKAAEINNLVTGAKEGESVSATVVVSSLPLASDEVKPEEANAIKDKVGADSALSFYDLSVKLVVEKKNADDPSQNESIDSAVSQTAAAIPFQIKFDELVGKDVKVARYHDGAAELLSDAHVDYATGVVTFYGDKFSTYAVALADSNVTVTFDAQGGSAVEKADVAKGDLITEPAAPTREGYEFAGWYTDETFATAWDFAADRATGDMVLYAKWTQNATPDVPATATRLGGADRYATMARVSQEAFPDKGSCQTVIVARGNDYPDALAAAGLAGIEGAQVLLTPTADLTAAAKSEIVRLGATKAYVLGDENAISKDTFNAVKDLVNGNAERVGGADRFDTALKIYKAGGDKWGATAIVAFGMKPYDALSASPIAYAKNAPIFLADANGDLSAETLGAIKAGGFDTVLVMGSSVAVSEKAEAELAKLAAVERFDGEDRYDTSQLAATWALENGLSCSNVVLAAGGEDRYADSLVASSLGGRNASPLLLVADGPAVTMQIEKVLVPNKADVETAYVLGDKNAVSEAVFEAIAKALK